MNTPEDLSARTLEAALEDSAPLDPPVLPSAGEIVVFDTEYTAWKGSLERSWSEPWEHREVVQIGAVRLDARTLDEVAALDVIVRPVINPELSEYFIDLTGITNDRVRAEGVTLAEGLDRFEAFIGDARPVMSNGDDRRVIQRNCLLVDMACPLPVDWFRNIRGALTGLLTGGDGHMTSHTLAAFVGEDDTGRAHDGLADARSIATALRVLRRDGKI